jgi:hypothetical protein
MNGSTDMPPRGLFVTGRGFVLPAAIWALYFAVIYAVQGGACAAAPDGAAMGAFGSLRVILLVITLVAAAAIAASGFWSWRTWRRVQSEARRDVAFDRSRFLSQGALLNALLFLIATLWIGLPILLFDPCRGHAAW